MTEIFPSGLVGASAPMLMLPFSSGRQPKGGEGCFLYPAERGEQHDYMERCRRNCRDLVELYVRKLLRLLGEHYAFERVGGLELAEADGVTMQADLVLMDDWRTGIPNEFNRAAGYKLD